MDDLAGTVPVNASCPGVTRKVVFLFHKSTEYLQHDTILETDNLGKQDN